LKDAAGKEYKELLNNLSYKKKSEVNKLFDDLSTEDKGKFFKMLPSDPEYSIPLKQAFQQSFPKIANEFQEWDTKEINSLISKGGETDKFDNLLKKLATSKKDFTKNEIDDLIKMSDTAASDKGNLNDFLKKLDSVDKNKAGPTEDKHWQKAITKGLGSGSSLEK
jgi:tRNA U34 5-carboxymethylaminomethyl modifying enzyme MnmG/GidA